MNCKSGIICNTETPKKVLENEIEELKKQLKESQENDALNTLEILKIQGVI